MPEELVCPIHGPYDAALGSCPYPHPESAGRPMAPAPLDEDDLPTDLGAGPARAGGNDEEEPTDLGVARRGRGFLDEDEVTELRRERDDVTEIDEAEQGPLALLWVKDGMGRGRIFRIKDGANVGRKDGEVVLDDPKVSNPHAGFRYENDQFSLWDFASRNGTFVNGERIRAATPLKENDEIKMGDTTFVFKILP